jgi:hypothetical protein
VARLADDARRLLLLHTQYGAKSLAGVAAKAARPEIKAGKVRFSSRLGSS